MGTLTGQGTLVECYLGHYPPQKFLFVRFHLLFIGSVIMDLFNTAEGDVRLETVEVKASCFKRSGFAIEQC